MILSLNLIIEIKDGGSHKNNRPMKTYREKQIYKEKMITNLGTYNYIRLTDNDFGQLLSMLAEMKFQQVESNDTDKTPMYRIHEAECNYLESVGCIITDTLSKTYLPARVDVTGKMIDECSYEVCTMKPININQAGKILFEVSINDAASLIKENIHGVDVQCEYLDENDVTKGISLIIVDETIGDIDVMG
jgi:hypothetical protein